jgi:hypothetical protein
MNKSMSKIRHIQEANLKLEKRLLKEDDVSPEATSAVDKSKPLTGMQQGMKLFFNNLSEMNGGQWVNAPNDPMAGKADVFNEVKVIGPQFVYSSPVSQGKRMFFRLKNAKTPTQKKLYFYVKYDAQPGPNGPIPRVYFQFTGLDRKETPMAITSVEKAQDVLTQLERFVNSEQ